MSSSHNLFSTLLHRISQGDNAARDDLIPILYEELRVRAAFYMSRERADSTLQATALVHEALIKLLGEQSRESPQWESQRHFFNAAAEAMRRLLVDRARQRKSIKRGGERSRVDLEAIEIASAAETSVDHEAISAALDRLKADDPRRHQVVMYRYYAGLSDVDIASLLGTSVKTVQRDWKTAKMFLLAELGER